MALVLREISNNGNISEEKRIVFKNNREEDKENYVVEHVKPIEKVKELYESSIIVDEPEKNSFETDDKKNSIEEFPKPNLDYDLLESSVEEYHETDNEPKSSSSPEDILAKVVRTKTTQGSFKSPAKIALLFGYIGIGHLGFYQTRNRSAQNLYNDIVKAIFASEHPDKKIRLNSLKTACKTPENGSALCQVVVLPRFEATLEERLDKINENLPDHIVCFGARKVIPTFHPKYACKIVETSNYQKFKYFLPSYALDSNCEEFVYNYRVSDKILDKTNGILKEFEGRHFFHNFSGTLKGAANAKNYRRVIKAHCEEPYVIDGLEMVELTFIGENFMVLQVPSIVGFVLAYMRGYASKKTLRDAWEPPLMDLPCAPSSGLLLENIRYGSYNRDLIRKEYRDENGRIYCPLDWSSEDDKVAGLRATIVASIVHLEKTEHTTAKWIKNELRKHSYRKFTSKNGAEKLSRNTSRVSLSKGNIENQSASTSALKEKTFDQPSTSALKSNPRKTKKSPKSDGKNAIVNSFNLAGRAKPLDQSSSSGKKKKINKSTKTAGKEAFNSDKIEKVLDSIPGTAREKVRDALLDAVQQMTQDISKMVLVNDTKITPAKFEERVTKELSILKIKEKIRNYVYQYTIRNAHIILTVPQPREPLDFIQKAQTSWERRIFKSLNSMFNELGIPLSKKRPISEQKDLEAKWCELSTEDIDLSRIRPLYSPKDFLDVLLNVRSPNWSSSSSAGDSGASSVWGQIKVPLKVKTFSQIKKAYHEMAIKSTHVGLDNVADDYLELGYKVLETWDPLLAREYAKHGCFPGIRTQIWAQILGIKSDDDEKLKFLQLKSYVIQHDMLVDKLIFKDIRLTSSNDDQYFVFEDVLYQILLAFSRDASVLEHFHCSSASPATGYLRGRLNQEGAVVIYPPNGVIPFHGFSMYLTPLCFLTEDPVLMYNIFKEFYCRYFFRLHILSSHSQGILSLCLLLETLLQEIDPQLTYHFANKELYPLKIAVKWLMRGFSGYLNAEQILLLWDRILAYDTLELLSILAVAIFVFRKPFLMAAENQTNLEAMLNDISTIKVVPLLTWFFRGPSSSVAK